jgi:hypothetical protein
LHIRERIAVYNHDLEVMLKAQIDHNQGWMENADMLEPAALPLLEAPKLAKRADTQGGKCVDMTSSGCAWIVVQAGAHKFPRNNFLAGTSFSPKSYE